ncbi:MAG: sensor domain-containing diguanylate cyclase [Actinomycetota bacterium]|nr:sensor domain-containing diguanylate cyclase [Actinomycetota bacterium]
MKKPWLDRGDNAALMVAYNHLVDRGLLLVRAGHVAWANRAMASLVGYSESQLTGTAVADLCPGIKADQPLRSTESDVTVTHASGAAVDMLARQVPCGTDGGHEDWMLELAHPRDSSLDARQARAFKERFWVLADRAPVGIFLSEAGLRLQYVNDHCAALCKVPAERLLGLGWQDFVDPSDLEVVRQAMVRALDGSQVSCQVGLLTASGELRQCNIGMSGVIGPDGAASFVGTIDDVTESITLQQQLQYAANHDPMTGLPNRSALDNALEVACRGLATGELCGLALVLCDLDRFKHINDTLGHLAGDRLLQEMAGRLRMAARPGHTVYRLGGDEFVVLAPGVCSHQDADYVQMELHGAMDEPTCLGGASIRMTASFGHVLAEREDGPTSLLEKADRSMYAQKAARRRG